MTYYNVFSFLDSIYLGREEEPVYQMVKTRFFSEEDLKEFYSSVEIITHFDSFLQVLSEEKKLLVFLMQTTLSAKQLLERLESPEPSWMEDLIDEISQPDQSGSVSDLDQDEGARTTGELSRLQSKPERSSASIKSQHDFNPLASSNPKEDQDDFNDCKKKTVKAESSSGCKQEEPFKDLTQLEQEENSNPSDLSDSSDSFELSDSSPSKPSDSQDQTSEKTQSEDLLPETDSMEPVKSDSYADQKASEQEKAEGADSIPSQSASLHKETDHDSDDDWPKAKAFTSRKPDINPIEKSLLDLKEEEKSRDKEKERKEKPNPEEREQNLKPSPQSSSTSKEVRPEEQELYPAANQLQSEPESKLKKNPDPFAHWLKQPHPKQEKPIEAGTALQSGFEPESDLNKSEAIDPLKHFDWSEKGLSIHREESPAQNGQLDARQKSTLNQVEANFESHFARHPESIPPKEMVEDYINFNEKLTPNPTFLNNAIASTSGRIFEGGKGEMSEKESLVAPFSYANRKRRCYGDLKISDFILQNTIQAFLQRPLPEFWESFGPKDRRDFFHMISIDPDYEEKTPCRLKTKVCIEELIVEALQRADLIAHPVLKRNLREVMNSLDNWQQVDLIEPIYPYLKGEGWIRMDLYDPELEEYYPRPRRMAR